MKSSSQALLQAGVRQGAVPRARVQQESQKPMGEFLQLWEAQNTREHSGGLGGGFLWTMGRTWQWRLIPLARDKHVWDNSCHSLLCWLT